MNISYIDSTCFPMDEQILISSRLVIFTEAVNFFIGIPLNIYVIFHLTRAGGLDESVFFSVSQSALEIFYALSTPMYILHMVGFCYVIAIKFFTGIGMIARFTFLCLACVERYLAVVHPITFLKFKPLKYCFFFLILTWKCVLAYSITFMFLSEIVLLDFIAVFYVVIVIVDLFCCVSILKVLKRQAPGQREDIRMSSTKKKAFKIVLINLLTHLVQLLPLVIIYIFRYVLSLGVLKAATHLSLAMNIAVGLIPPLFFLHRAGKLTVYSFCLLPYRS